MCSFCLMRSLTLMFLCRLPGKNQREFLSSSRGDEDEDEVFVGPVSHKEKCVSVNVASPLENHSITWSPLTGEQLEAVCQEAHRLASQLQSTVSHDENRDATSVTMDTMTEQEEFVEDAETRLGLLAQTTSGVSPNKRQTFCVQDSPLKQLPPVIQRQLQRGSGSSITSSIRPTITPASSTRPTSKSRLSTCSPVIQAKPQPRTALRGKSALGVAVVLPSKPTIPVTSCSTNKSRVEKTKLQPPNRAVGSWRQSPSSCPPKRVESSEDLLSDSASVASDISDSSLNSSLLGKRALPRPTKQSGVRNLSGGKAQRLQTRRKNTSSSSSSVSSFNSSISLSPAKGKVKSTLNGNLSSSTGPAPRKVNSLSRPRRSTIYSAAESVSSTAAGRRSISTQAKKLSEAESGNGAKSTPHKSAEATPPKRPASNLTTSTSRLQSGPKAKSKPEAVVLPTPSTGGKGVHHANDVSKVLKPKRLMSLNGMDSLPQKPSAGPLTPSAITCKSLQMKPRRPSALPTPVRRKASLIPSPTPKPPALSDSVPTSYTKQHSCSPTLTNAQEEEEELVDAPEIQPFCLEDDPPTTTPSNSQQTNQSEPMDPGALILDESVPNENLIELELKEDSNSKKQEVLLLDLPPPTLPPQEKLLIDLTNTPDFIRTNNKTCSAAQLIDLSSPLIKWSPEDKTENNAPLINLSF
ncbi:G2 and S phase-expressed protein 1 isoform X5 [Pundamilia nyererei]|uniref:G2 and S phase-expressed protein 1 isoform X5 n=1 Tax=Pundamilia nyererei TaxID=303518 RepID=A0A9Y3VWX9_9CICH|nr:PREDICTED: G2 and S phase-expressed protein 1 isoform X5 [Pundamilia nyererei]